MLMKPVEGAELEKLRLALSGSGLPFDDVGQPGQQFFRFELDGDWIAYGGLEGEGPDRLLRSMVVADSRRGQGIGTRMLAALERYACGHNVLALHLLTNSAADFFSAHGYSRLDRCAAPDSISQTAQFSTLCGSSAIYLCKTLSASDWHR
ncbi:hypothetical protein D3C84_309190 [compost metagenome]